MAKRDLCIMACVLCKEPAFQEWTDLQTGAGRSEATAKAFVLEKCQIESRTQLDKPEVAPRFHSLVRKPYLKWKEPA
jgi:hypothetical protein